MTVVAIAICTYERNAGLGRLIEAIQRLVLPASLAESVQILVVDNSRLGVARVLVENVRNTCRFPLHYIAEPRKGLAHARNAALNAARQVGAAYVAFIDDDEVPESDWLAALWIAATETGAPAVLGPVYPVFERPPSRWLSVEAYVTHPVVTRGYVRQGYTSNALVSMQAIEQHGLVFDGRFNDTGGEDTIFFDALVRAGGRIAFADGARVHEFVDPKRMSAGWILRRWYRTGCTEANLGRFAAHSPAGRCHNFARGMVRIAVGAGLVGMNSIGAVWFGRDRILSSAYTLCRGAGLVANSLGMDFDEYSTRRYR